MAIFEVCRCAYPDAEDQGKVLGTVRFAGVPQSMDEKITAATGICLQGFEDGSLVTMRDVFRLPGTIMQLTGRYPEDFPEE